MVVPGLLSYLVLGVWLGCCCRSVSASFNMINPIESIIIAGHAPPPGGAVLEGMDALTKRMSQLHRLKVVRPQSKAKRSSPAEITSLPPEPTDPPLPGENLPEKLKHALASVVDKGLELSSTNGTSDLMIEHLKNEINAMIDIRLQRQKVLDKIGAQNKTEAVVPPWLRKFEVRKKEVPVPPPAMVAGSDDRSHSGEAPAEVTAQPQIITVGVPADLQVDYNGEQPPEPDPRLAAMIAMAKKSQQTQQKGNEPRDVQQKQMPNRIQVKSSTIRYINPPPDDVEPDAGVIKKQENSQVILEDVLPGVQKNAKPRRSGKPILTAGAAGFRALLGRHKAAMKTRLHPAAGMNTRLNLESGDDAEHPAAKYYNAEPNNSAISYNEDVHPNSDEHKPVRHIEGHHPAYIVPDIDPSLLHNRLKLPPIVVQCPHCLHKIQRQQPTKKPPAKVTTDNAKLPLHIVTALMLGVTGTGPGKTTMAWVPPGSAEEVTAMTGLASGEEAAAASFEEKPKKVTVGRKFLFARAHDGQNHQGGSTPTPHEYAARFEHSTPQTADYNNVQDEEQVGNHHQQKPITEATAVPLTVIGNLKDETPPRRAMLAALNNAVKAQFGDVDHVATPEAEIVYANNKKSPKKVGELRLFIFPRSKEVLDGKDDKDEEDFSPDKQKNKQGKGKVNQKKKDGNKKRSRPGGADVVDYTGAVLTGVPPQSTNSKRSTKWRTMTTSNSKSNQRKRENTFENPKDDLTAPTAPGAADTCNDAYSGRKVSFQHHKKRQALLVTTKKTIITRKSTSKPVKRGVEKMQTLKPILAKRGVIDEKLQKLLKPRHMSKVVIRVMRGHNKKRSVEYKRMRRSIRFSDP